MEMSKTAFAAHIRVSQARVSQYIRDGIIGAEAMVGDGRNARINAEVAIAQIASRRHVGQALGNGLQTRLDDQPAAGHENDEPRFDMPPRVVDTATLIQQERLEQERRKNRLATVDEAERLARLVPVDDMRREVGRSLQRLADVYNGMVPDIASAVAAKFSVPQRDVEHLVRGVMRDKRAAAAAREKNAAAGLPETVEATV